MLIPIEKLASERIDPFVLLDVETRQRLLRAARTGISILLLGETGTGKGQMARAIARHSKFPRVIEVNCAALPDELLGSELFGHKRGAFTGAVSDRKGILGSALNKTVFLDEIGEISPKMQRMLLSAVQRSNRTMKPLGADAEVTLPKLRYIFATNRGLEMEAAAGRFREDLLRRIDVLSVTIPPLRSRPELISGYVGTFLKELSDLHGIPVAGIEPQALKMLERSAWPGNVRELKNALERALVTTEERKKAVISERDLAAPASRTTIEKSAASLEEAEEASIRKALKLANGKIKDAMELLGIKSRSTLYFRLRKYGIEIEKKPR